MSLSHENIDLSSSYGNNWSDLAKIQKKIPACISEYDAVSEIAEKHGLGEAETIDIRPKSSPTLQLHRNGGLH